MKKILLVTQSFPPSTGGSATLIWQLVKYWTPDELVVVHGTPGTNPTKFATYPVTFGTTNWMIRLQKHLAGWYIKAIEHQIKRLISDHQVSHLYLHYPNAPFVVAGYRVARALGLPYSIYFDILWEERKHIDTTKHNNTTKTQQYNIKKKAQSAPQQWTTMNITTTKPIRQPPLVTYCVQRYVGIQTHVGPRMILSG